MQEQLITIEITSPEAILFRQYQQHHDLFMNLSNHGVFDIQFGKCTLNFANGDLQNVIKEEVIYRKT